MVFQDKWTDVYFCIQYQDKTPCLICQETVGVMKDYNCKRHYESKHSKHIKPFYRATEKRHKRFGKKKKK